MATPETPLTTRLASLALVILGGTACIQTQSSRVASPGPVGLVRTATPERAWRVREEGETNGFVVFFGSHQDPSESFYSVRNRWQQELGVIDSLGVTWRFVPHEREAAHVTTGSVLEGASALLEASAPCVLEEMEVSELARQPDPQDE